MIPLELQEAVECIKNAAISMPSISEDGRHNSMIAESDIISCLKDSLKSVSLPARKRDWYDVKIDHFYCDIKIADLDNKTADNTNAKGAIFYFLTGKNPSTDVSFQDAQFFKLMRESESPCEKRDYYYLVFNKSDPKDVFVVSLKHIERVRPSGRNLPFQCVWGECRNPVQRTYLEARDYMLSQWAVSIKKLVDNTEKGMPKYYPEFF